MWALIVAGHVVQTFDGARQCQDALTLRSGGEPGQCVQLQPSQPPPSPTCTPIGGGMFICDKQ